MLYVPTIAKRKWQRPSVRWCQANSFISFLILISLCSYSHEINEHEFTLHSSGSAESSTQWSRLNYLFMSGGLLIGLVMLIAGCARCRDPGDKKKKKKNGPLDDENAIEISIQPSYESAPPIVSKIPEPNEGELAEEKDDIVSIAEKREELQSTESLNVLKRQRSHLEIMVDSMNEKYQPKKPVSKEIV